jgi:hypothetical protein
LVAYSLTVYSGKMVAEMGEILDKTGAANVFVSNFFF